MRLIRNVEGEPWPLILHPRLAWLREADCFVRGSLRRLLGLPWSAPRYLTIERTPEQRADALLACEAFVGAHSPDPRLARYYGELRRLGLLADARVSEERKRCLIGEGPRCSPEDEGYALSLPVGGRDVAAAAAADAALERLKERGSSAGPQAPAKDASQTSPVGAGA